MDTLTMVQWPLDRVFCDSGSVQFSLYKQMREIDCTLHFQANQLHCDADWKGHIRQIIPVNS